VVSSQREQENAGTNEPAGRILTMAIETVAMDAIRPYPGNARLGNRKVIGTSLSELGQYKPIIVQRSTGHILVGNNTYLTAQDQGWREIAVQWVDVDDVRAREINLIDNRSNDLAGYDETLLLQLLEDVPDLSVTGYAEEDVEALLRATDAIGNSATDFLSPFLTPAAPAASAAGSATRPVSPDTPTGQPLSSAEASSQDGSDVTAAPAGAPDSPAKQDLYVPVSWTVSVVERDEIRAALRVAQDHWQLATASDALLAVVRFFTQRQE
jgi:ParB-like chromosome segregation protein Spo0J